MKPKSREDVEALLISELTSLPDDALAALSPLVVSLEPLVTGAGPGSDGQSYWLVARDGDRVLYWDSVEEEFATGELNGQDLTNISLCGKRLEACVRRFVGKH